MCSAFQKIPPEHEKSISTVPILLLLHFCKFCAKFLDYNWGRIIELQTHLVLFRWRGIIGQIGRGSTDLLRDVRNCRAARVLSPADPHHSLNLPFEPDSVAPRQHTQQYLYYSQRDYHANIFQVSQRSELEFYVNKSVSERFDLSNTISIVLISYFIGCILIPIRQ